MMRRLRLLFYAEQGYFVKLMRRDGEVQSSESSSSELISALDHRSAVHRRHAAMPKWDLTSPVPTNCDSKR